MQVIALFTVLGLAVGATGDGEPSHDAPAAPDTWRARADHILTLPRGSVSLGHTSHGRLRKATKMPRRGKGFALLPHIPKRKTRFATREMVGLLTRTAARVRARFKYSVLRIGNLGYRDGGRIPWSISHRAGRDADIAFFTKTRRGRRVKLKDFVRFNRDGVSRDGKARFDTRRNLEVVRALLSDRSVNVQWIFVSRHLRRKLLRHAKRSKLPSELIVKMKTVMRQPSDSAPHNDHFHVRIYCSAEDVLHGCQNRGPFHPWVRPATAAYRQRVGELKALTRAPEASYRRRAIQKLVALNARSAAPTVIAALDDANDRVFDAAVDALRRLMPASESGELAGPLKRQERPARAAAVMKLLAHFNTTEGAAIALSAVTAPATSLSKSLQSPATRADTWRAALPVIGKHGRKEAALALVRALPGLRRAGLQEAAHVALRRITNNDVAAAQVKKRRKTRGDGLIARWRAFVNRHGAESWAQWLRIGFEARGFRFKRRMWSFDSIPTLVRAAAHRDEWLNANAIRVLNGLTGKSIDPDRRSRKWRARYFRNYWRQQKRSGRR